MKDWVNKKEVSRALGIALSKRFNPMTVIDIMDDLSNATREEELKTKADICREFAMWLSSLSRDKSDPAMEYNANRWVEDFIAEMESEDE